MKEVKKKEIRGMTLNQLLNIRNEVNTELVGRCYGLHNNTALIKETEEKKILIITLTGNEDLINSDPLIDYYLTEVMGNRNYNYIEDSFVNIDGISSKQYIVK